jgi:hypothetical protein
MVDHPMETLYTNDGEPSTAPGRIPTERVSRDSLLSNSLYAEMGLPVLAAHCMRELNNSFKGEPCTDTYGVELIRHAIVQGDQQARAWVQHCFGGVVLDWLRQHPQRAQACLLESEEDYVTQTFERFWQATASNQQVECNTLAAALHHLRASLHSAILDTLRAYARSRKISRPVHREPHMEDMTSSSEVWDILKTLLSNPREVRLAYLFFHCGMGPREIVHVCPQEFDDVGEVYGLRRTIMERLLCHADRFALATHTYE